MYESIIKPILFLFGPEFIHDFFVSLGESLGTMPGGDRSSARFAVMSIRRLRRKWRVLISKIPSASRRDSIRTSGSRRSCRRSVSDSWRSAPSRNFRTAGIPAVVLLRLPADRSIIVYYGLKNIGAEAIKKNCRDFCRSRSLSA